jgi:integrase
MAGRRWNAPGPAQEVIAPMQIEPTADGGVMFVAYACEWVATYAGRTAHGFRETTRAEYRRDLGFSPEGVPLDRAAVFFRSMRLDEIQPRQVKQYLTHLSAQGLASQTVRKLFAPLRALLSTAVEEGLIRQNPSIGVRVPPPTQPRLDTRRKSLTAEEYARLIAEVDPRWRLFVEVAFASGFRVSELIALEWRDVDFADGYLRVERRYYKGLGEPKTRFGRRKVPVTPALLTRLAERRRGSRFPGERDPVFCTRTGAHLNYANLYHRMLRPAMRAAGVEWGGFHRLRHSCGTELRRRGATDKQVQLWLGHHDPAYTSRIYIHLTHADLPDPALLDDFRLGRSGQPGA